jgi:glycerol-3-phosphate acyltransferase PlsY
MVFRIIITALVCYFLGNHNGAISVSRMLGDDVRSHGSGNAGLTNFIRNYGASRSLLVIAIDVLKAVFACLIAGFVFEPLGYGLEGRILGGVAVMLGHDFPALQGFRGGKGILSGWFIAWCCDWRVGLAIGVVFFTVYLLTQYVSLASIMAAATFAIAFAVFHSDNVLVVIGAVFMGLLTIFQHRSNVKRLLKGEECRTNLFKKGKNQ